jgi:hypothetical protein
MRSLYRNAFFLMLFALLIAASAGANDWNEPSGWVGDHSKLCNIALSPFNNGSTNGIRADINLSNGGTDDNWVIMDITPELPEGFDLQVPVVFNFRAEASCTLEIKMIDDNGTVYRRLIPLVNDKYRNWTSFVVYLENLEYGWPPGRIFDKLEHFEIAFSDSQNKTGTAWITGAGFGQRGENSTFVDPNAALRCDERLNPENASVLEWLEFVQDNSPSNDMLLPSRGKYDHVFSTYDNALVAMAFMLKDKPERAEKILDFYANQTNPKNDNLRNQNFFFNGEPRGFYQQFVINRSTNGAYYDGEKSNRSVGDMCWLMLAYQYYGEKYHSERYNAIEMNMMKLLENYSKSDNVGCFVRRGWRNGDTLPMHGNESDPDYKNAECNIDAYAAMMHEDNLTMASNIKKWLDNNVSLTTGRPLDSYTYRNLSGEADGWILSYPDGDLKYPITLDYQGKKVMGICSGTDEGIGKIWVDGVGQMACAFYEAERPEKGNFYANQMDSYLINETIDGKQYWVLPYNIKKGDHDPGAISCAAWYIFAKNQFNPMKLKSNQNNTR